MSDDFRDKWPDMRMKHLELIQNALSRMGNNSANLKSYCMTMVAAIIGLSAAVSKEQIILYSLPVVGAFAFLDANYLALERGFRRHFDEVRLNPYDKQPDFLIVPTKGHSFIRAFFSWSVLAFYLGIAGAMLVIYYLMPAIVEAS